MVVKDAHRWSIEARVPPGFKYTLGILQVCSKYDSSMFKACFNHGSSIMHDSSGLQEYLKLLQFPFICVKDVQ